MVSINQKTPASDAAAKAFNPDALSVKVFWIGSILFFILSIVYNWWFFLFVLGALLFYTPIIVLHELGHAISDLILGGKIQYIQLGYPSRRQPQPWQFHFMGLPWRLYFPLTTGCVAAEYYSRHLYRFKRSLSIMGGPLANGVALITPFIALILLGDEGPSTGSPVIPLLIVWTLLNGYLIFVTVWPNHWTLRAHPPQYVNDSRLLWQTLHYTEPQIQAFIENALIRREYLACEAAYKDKPLSELLVHTDGPDSDWGSLGYAVARLEKEKHPRLFEYLLMYSEAPSLTTAHVTNLIDYVLTHQLSEGPFSDPVVIDKLSLKLIEKTETTSTRGTRGCLLIDHGSLEEGRAILLDVLSQSSNPTEQSYSTIFLALAEKHEGKPALAQILAERAAKIDPNCPALKRVSDLLPPLAGKSVSDPSPSSS